MSRIILIIAAVFLASVAHAATLGIPGPGTTQSGVGVISGWKCRANGRLTIRFDGGSAVPLVYGSEREDTRGACGDTNNGFVAIWNWAKLDDGRHTAVVYDNGVEFDRATFTVVTTGVDFLRGVTGSGTATLSNGQRATLEWNQASQAFVATDFTAPGGGGNDLNDLLGTWRFSSSTLSRSYTVRGSDLTTCPLRAGGTFQCFESSSQRFRAILLRDIIQSPIYTYAIVEYPTTASGLCREWQFDVTGNIARGRYAPLYAEVSGAAVRCTSRSPASSWATATGTRSSALTESVIEPDYVPQDSIDELESVAPLLSIQ